jgi:hypothetical protein
MWIDLLEFFLRDRHDAAAPVEQHRTRASGALVKREDVLILHCLFSMRLRIPGLLTGDGNGLLFSAGGNRM